MRLTYKQQKQQQQQQARSGEQIHAFGIHANWPTMPVLPLKSCISPHCLFLRHWIPRILGEAELWLVMKKINQSDLSKHVQMGWEV